MRDDVKEIELLVLKVSVVVREDNDYLVAVNFAQPNQNHVETRRGVLLMV